MENEQSGAGMVTSPRDPKKCKDKNIGIRQSRPQSANINHF